MKLRQFLKSTSQLVLLLILVGGCAALAWRGWPQAVRWHKERLADRLATQAAAAPDPRSKVLIHQLASLGTPALDPLVSAVASPRAAIADTAREEIDLFLANHQLRMARQVSPENVAALVELSAALADHAPKFRPGSKQWAEAIALKLIDLCELLPAEEASHILQHGSQLLESTPPRGPRLQSVEAISPAPLDPEPMHAASSAIDVRQLAVPTERTLAKREQLLPPSTAPADAVPPNKLRSPERSSVPPAESTLRRRDPQVSTTPWDDSGESSISVDVGPPIAALPLPRWVDVPTPAETRRRAVQLRKLSTTVLLDNLPQADPLLAAAIRDRLHQRGMSQAEIDLEQRISSADVAHRLQLVKQVAQLPAASARRQLRRLLQDVAPEVRLEALATLATTGDPQLAELAREMALSDMDPRVADLATELMRK